MSIPPTCLGSPSNAPTSQQGPLPRVAQGPTLIQNPGKPIQNRDPYPKKLYGGRP